MIKKIEITKRVLHLWQPFKITYEESSQEKIIFIKLVDAQGNTGLASASCDISVNHETPDSLIKVLQKKLVPAFFEWPIEQWYLYHEKILKVFNDYPTAQSAVETAILNLWASKQKLSLWQVFGGYRASCPVAFSISIKSLEETIVSAKQRVKEGFSLIKLKGGLNVNDDIEKILKVSAILPKNVSLLLDINHGYSFEQAKFLINRVKKSRLQLIEQPVGLKNWTGLKKLHHWSPIPIIADESAISLEDCQKLLLGDYVAGINIKLMKCGGPINFLKIFHLAKSLNKIVMIGCMYESVASLTMSAQLALGLPVDYVDLDSGPIDFCDDPAKGGIIYKRGQLQLGTKLTMR